MATDLIDEIDDEWVIKVCLLGEGAVGKTSLRKCFAGEKITESSPYIETIGADFSSMKWRIDGEPLTFNVWDLAGQPRFSEVRKLFYKGGTGALFVVSVVTQESYDNYKNWVNEFWTHNGRGTLPVIIAGNKVDLRDVENPEHVSSDRGRELAEELSEIGSEHGWECAYLETSALTGANVTELFEAIARTIKELIGK